MLANDEFIEWAEVFGKRYGTGVKALESQLGEGLDVLLAAMSQMGPEVTLWIASNGPDTARLQARTRGDARIQWLGRLTDEEKFRRLRGAHHDAGIARPMQDLLRGVRAFPIGRRLSIFYRSGRGFAVENATRQNGARIRVRRI